MKKLTLWSLLVGLLAAGWWLYTGPQRTLAAIKVAADTNNEAVFRKLVDVPAMQADMLAQLLGPPDPTAGPILVNGLSMLGLNQTATPRGMQPYFQAYQAPILGLWGGQGGAGEYAATDRYLFTLATSPGGSQGSTLVLQRQQLQWRLVTVKVPSAEISVPVTTTPKLHRKVPLLWWGFFCRWPAHAGLRGQGCPRQPDAPNGQQHLRALGRVARCAHKLA